ncbi:MAG: DUF5723 family protein [candidate division Zixibacteria bacterium]|nr:DUF5723 family protein [candidate division Zixibacteria bacterium]MDH3937759.1 DUF5723 family protein [candidate division Zixibacteria bacterium]
MRITTTTNESPHRKRMFYSAACLGVTLLLLAGSALAGGQSSARSMAMSGAYMSLASGVDAARYNPANLGFQEYRQTGLELVGVGVNIANNSISLGDYNRYTGAILTDADKREILDKVPDEGLNLIADVEASAFSLSYNSFVFSVTGVGVADVNLSKDIIELVFNGNTFGKEIELTGSYSDAVAYVATGLSYGRQVAKIGHRRLAVGGTFKYIKGLAVEEISELEGGVTTLETGFSGDGRMIARTATGGSGYAVDIGGALELNRDYTVGLSIKNFLSNISWSGDAEEHGYLFSFDTMTADNMDEDYVVSEDYTKEIAGFSNKLPATMTIGIANVSGQLLWAVDWQQGFHTGNGASTKPRLAAGLEWNKFSVLPLRTGFAVGGNKGSVFSVGSGLHLGAFRLDFAAQTGSSFSPYSTRGLNFALATGVEF